MSFPASSFDFRRFRSAALAAAVLMVPAFAQADSAPFANFAGNWAGNGTITIAEGGTERIRCRGTYTVDGSGNNLHQVLRCASDSYRFELTSDIAARGGNITGSWSEASRGVNGTVEGSIANGQVSALVQTNGYAASFNVTTRGNKQSVNISSKGELRGVTISLARTN
ncbi:hypothetical protein YH63_021520 [Afipia massiliensis]|uniref:DUF3617 family protein n=1 Tax=Afipia massiliensis TaxID=211460 RepID=A0A4U6BVK6_9BRAD|nr:hypothetical protein [Afipia massiliensis]TKT74111.1 hypothetical protein YH63_021520 [Afipia massiliensis]